MPAAGPQRAQAALTALLDGLALDASASLDAICAGTAGLSVAGVADVLRARLSPLTRSGKVVIVTDATLVLPAAGLDAGVAVICGTGSVAVGSWQGKTVQMGGWGYLLGDEGSGYWIVREALRVLLDRRDRGSPPGELGSELLSATGAEDLASLHLRYFQQPHLPRQWAQHARVVLESADPAAAGIAAHAAEAAADLASSAIRSLGAPAGLPVVLAGGLLGNAEFASAARRAVAHTLPESEARVLADEPVTGAVRLALQAAIRV